MEGPSRRYVMTETFVSIVMSLIMNSAMTFAIFSGSGMIELWGGHGVVFDLAPTTFMTVLMSAAIPGWLTERRMSRGVVSAAGVHAPALRGNAFVRALTLAVLIAVGMVALASIAAMGIGRLGISSLSFNALLGLKWALSVVVPTLVTPLAIREALARRARTA